MIRRKFMLTRPLRIWENTATSEEALCVKFDFPKVVIKYLKISNSIQKLLYSKELCPLSLRFKRFSILVSILSGMSNEREGLCYIVPKTRETR